MKFAYEAIKNDGTKENGIIESPDKFSLSKQLRSEGKTLLNLKIVGEKKSLTFSFGSGVGLSEKIMFTKNLSGMLSAGLALARAISILERQTKNVVFKDVLSKIVNDISGGSTFSSSMEKFPKIFSTLFISMVRAGEESGGMVGALNEIGQSLEKTYSLNKKIKGALMYPSIIISAIFIIGILMFIFVVPTLTKTFKDVGAELPSSTKVVIWISDTLSNHLLLVILFIIISSFGVYFFGKSSFTKKYADKIILKLPIIGNIAREANSARTARTLASLLIAGVPVTRALDITKEVLQNSLYKKLIEDAKVAVEKGDPLSAVFKSNENLYPVMFGEMVEVGEETGKLSQMLIDVALFYEGEVESKTKDLSTIIEPVLMIFIGVAVGFFAVSMLSPMYSLMDNI
jgi:type IV pilus assembly protein PilC